MSDPARDRPRMPAGYGIAATDAPGLTSWDAVRERLAAARNYWVATTRPDGRPHVMPVWGLWFEEAFCFSTDPASQKGRNLAANAALAVHLESGDDVVILEGTAEAVVDRAFLDRFADAYDAKYEVRMEFGSAEYGVYRLRPRAAFAWQERDFPASATRFRF